MGKVAVAWDNVFRSYSASIIIIPSNVRVRKESLGRHLPARAGIGNFLESGSPSDHCRDENRLARGGIRLGDLP